MSAASGAATSHRVVAGRKCWLAQHASNSPSEDMNCVEEIGSAVFAGVFDGHGGQECAAYAATALIAGFRRCYRPIPVRAIDSLRAKFFESNGSSSQPADGEDVGTDTHAGDAARQLSAAFVDCDRQWLAQCATGSHGHGGRNLARAGACALACCEYRHP